ncbi:MAG TPA: D-2-hydroxyacid dehydrogenase [Vicinamibacterales bacterium]|nr:D-2-hydroxyacid dehydrogenase [Vicinamibacterales bacterium]
MHHLLILSRHASEYHRLIDGEHPPDLEIVSTADPAHALRDGAGCDLVLGEPSLIAQVLSQLTALRWVQATWAGVEPLLAQGLRRDYVLTNARGVFGPLMSEYVFGYLLAHERLIFSRHASQLAGRCDRTPPGSLRGKRIGLLGVGSIGADLAHTAQCFHMRVHGYTRATEACPDVDTWFHGDDLEAFARGLDYLVCVLPHTPATRGLVGERLLRALPQHAVFVNPGRGQVVDEDALADALQAGRLAGAVLDVFHEEPLPPYSVFWRLPNVLITGHTAALSFPEEIAPVFVDNYRRLLAGEPLKHQVDFERGY